MFAMTRWSPLASAFHLRREMDDLINRAVSPSWPLTEPAGDGGAEAGPTWWPAVESFGSDGTLGVRVALPGVAPEDVEVSVTDDVLTVKGERKAGHAQKEAGYYIRELAYGRFERQFELPEGIDPGRVAARFVNGMLEVTMPVPVAVGPQRVEIQIEGQGGDKRAVRAAA